MQPKSLKAPPSLPPSSPGSLAVTVDRRLSPQPGMTPSTKTMIDDETGEPLMQRPDDTAEVDTAPRI